MVRKLESCGLLILLDDATKHNPWKAFCRDVIISDRSGDATNKITGIISSTSF